MIKGLEALESIIFTFYNKDREDIKIVKKELKALDILREYIIIDEKEGYVEFHCHFSLPKKSSQDKKEKYKEKIDLLKEVLL